MVFENCEPALPLSPVAVAPTSTAPRAAEAIRSAAPRLAGGDGDVGRFARQKLLLGILKIDDRVVGHNVLNRVSIQADGAHPCAEDFGGISIHLKCHAGPGLDLPRIRLIGLGIHLHTFQVLGDSEYIARLEGGGHRLPHRDVARHGRPIDG
jgi:hypothetical protein